MKREKIRYYLIDGIRGCTLVSMVVFHALYDVFMTFGRDPRWYSRPAVHFWQQTICWSFILVSGFVWTWGRESNLRRGVKLNLFGLGISLVTWLVVPEFAVWFGIMNFFGCAVLLMFPAEKLARRIDPLVGIALSLLLFFFLRNISYGFVGFGELWRVALPVKLYECKLLMPLGLPWPEFFSSDYFPILPWFFLYLCGYFCGELFKKHRAWQDAARTKIPLLSYIGSKTLWVYLIHQPVCYFVCQMIFS